MRKNKNDYGGQTMIKPIVKDTIFLSQKSENATESDIAIAVDLMDTLRAHAENNSVSGY